MILLYEKINKIAKFFTLFASASLIVRRGVIKPYTIQPFELSIIIGFILLLVYTYFYRTDNYFEILFKKYGLFFLLIIIFISIGTIIGLTIYEINNENIIPIIKDFFLISTIFSAFFLNAYYGRSESFRKISLYCMCGISILSFFLFTPSLIDKFKILGNNNSLLGFHSNQNILATLILIPIAIYSQKIFSKKKWQFKIISWALFVLSLSLIIWTGSRGGWIAVAALIMFFIWSYSNANSSLNRFKKVIAMTLFVIFSLSISFTILPREVRIMAMDRIFPNITDSDPNPEKIKTITISTAIQKALFKSDSSISLTNVPYQNRQNIWPNAIKLFIKYPFGLGPEYARLSKALTEPDGRWVPAHNTILEIMLSGGIMLLIIVAFGFLYITKILISFTNNNERILLSGLWIGLFVSLLFNDFFFTLPWLWIITGIIIGKNEQQNNQSLV